MTHQHQHQKMVSSPVRNPGHACGYIAYLQCIRCLPGVDVLIAFITHMSGVFAARCQESHNCSAIVTALSLMVSDCSPNAEAVDVPIDYAGDTHSMFADRGVSSINEFLRNSMDVTHDLILQTVCLDGHYNINNLSPNTLYLCDTSEAHKLGAYLPRISYMSELGMELKSIVLQTGGYHFIALATWDDLIYEYNDSRLIGTFKSWGAVIIAPRFAEYVVTTAWYYHKQGRNDAESIWNGHLNSKFR